MSSGLSSERTASLTDGSAISDCALISSTPKSATTRAHRMVTECLKLAFSLSNMAAPSVLRRSGGGGFGGRLDPGGADRIGGRLQSGAGAGHAAIERRHDAGGNRGRARRRHRDIGGNAVDVTRQPVAGKAEHDAAEDQPG